MLRDQRVGAVSASPAVYARRGGAGPADGAGYSTPNDQEVRERSTEIMEHPGSEFAYLLHDVKVRNGLMYEANRRQLSQLEPRTQHRLAPVVRVLQTIAAQLADLAAPSGTQRRVDTHPEQIWRDLPP